MWHFGVSPAFATWSFSVVTIRTNFTRISLNKPDNGSGLFNKMAASFTSASDVSTRCFRVVRLFLWKVNLKPAFEVPRFKFFLSCDTVSPHLLFTTSKKWIYLGFRTLSVFDFPRFQTCALIEWGKVVGGGGGYQYPKTCFCWLYFSFQKSRRRVRVSGVSGGDVNQGVMGGYRHSDIYLALPRTPATPRNSALTDTGIVSLPVCGRRVGKVGWGVWGRVGDPCNARLRTKMWKKKTQYDRSLGQNRIPMSSARKNNAEQHKKKKVPN